MHHTYVWLSSIQVVFSILIVLAVSLVPALFGEGRLTSSSSDSSLILFVIGFSILFILLIIAAIVVVQILAYRNLYYEIGDKELSRYSGIITKKKVHVPYQRIQSVNQRATLLQRIFGVCTVHIDTAGGSSNKAVVIPYLQNTEAERLRTELFARKQMILSSEQQGQTAGLGQAWQPGQTGQPGYAAQGSNVLDAPAEIIADVRGVFGGAQIHTGEVSYEYGLSNKELILSGLSNNTGFALMLVAIIGSAFGLITQFLDTSIGQNFATTSTNYFIATFADNLIWVIVGSLLVAMVVIWVLSTVGSCISLGGFHAARRQNRIEIEHGLLQHQFHGVDVDRVQSVIIKQSFIRRIIGYCELSLGKIDAATDNSQDQEKNLNSRGLVIHPFVKMSRVPEILAGLVPEFADVPTVTIPLPKVSLRRALIRRCILLGNGFWLALMVAVTQLVLNVILPAVGVRLPENTLFYLNISAYALYTLCIVIAIVEAVNAVMWFRGSSFAYNARFMQITNGGFSRESISFPRQKIQYGYTRTNPFQRASKVATVNARTAAGIGGTTMKLVDAYEEDAEKWLDWVRPGQSVLE